jgi:hypothetical protein
VSSLLAIVISTNWKIQLQRLGISALFLFVISYQLRSSIETIHLARNLDFWLPFSVEPFSDHIKNISPGIVSVDPIAKTIPLDRDPPLHLLAINHRQFRGMSVYLTQLWNRHPTIGPDPTLQFWMRYGDSRLFAASFLIPHCTCATSSVSQLVQLFLLPPLFCVLLAVFIVLRQPQVPGIWAMSALLLAISQMDLFAHGARFQWIANTMAWTDGFRIPATIYRAFVQNIWPAALIVTASHLFPVRPAVQTYSRWLATMLLGWCLVQSLLAVGWSEYYLPFAFLYHSLQRHGAELSAATFVFVAALCFIHNRMLGVLVFVLALVASSAPYWSAPSITTGHGIALPTIAPLSGLSDRQFIPTVPMPLVSSVAVAPAFAVATALFVLALEFRRTERLLTLSLLLLLPPALYVLGVLNGNVVLGMWRWSYVMFVLLCAGSGLLGICTHCLSRHSE